MDLDNLKRTLIGSPFPTSMELHERLDKVRALAIFASDPISSNAYATEAMMTVLVVMGTTGLRLALPLGLAVALLVLLVVFSYIQTIFHYPGGGGAYIVAKDNLGTLPSLLAGAALLTDYVLTVSVSVSAGVRALTSAFPQLLEARVILALLAIGLLTWVNLRGIRESGTVFAVPTYSFVLGGLVVVAIGLVRATGVLGATPLVPLSTQIPADGDILGVAYIWILLRAFAAGCTALTGIEAISDGVTAFKPPESLNAVKTMIAMGIIAVTMFVGITYLATNLRLVPSEAESILSQLTRLVAGRGFLYFWVQAFTMLILFLAANTGFQDFPRLSSFLARDGFLPRWMQSRGDRLVFTSGIVALGAISSLIVILFQANEIAMLPLYALGVMLSFSLSQAGMFRLMGRIAHLTPGESLATLETNIKYERGTGWKRALNAVGAAITLAVFVVLMVTKFLEGAWIVVVLIPLLVGLFLEVNRHYQRVANALSTTYLDPESLTQVADVALVPIADVHRGVLRALQYARRLSREVRAVAVTTTPGIRRRLEQRWARFPRVTGDIQLVCLEYDFRDVLTPLVDYIERVNQEEFPDQLVTVVIPEFVTETLWERFLHNQTANRLRRLLKSQHDIVVIDVPYHILSTTQWRAGRTRAEVLGMDYSAAPDEPATDSVQDS